MSPPPIIPPIFLIAFTGFRPKQGAAGRSVAELENCLPLITEAIQRFQARLEPVGGKVHMLCGSAAGADLVAGRAARDLGIPMHLFLPLPESDFMEDFAEWPDQREEIRGFLRDAHDRKEGWSVRLASSSRRSGPHAICEGDNCYADVNFRMLDLADGVIAVTDLEGEKYSVSGSRQVWEDAKKRELPRIAINPATAAISAEQDMVHFADSEDSESGIALVQHLTSELAEDMSERPENFEDFRKRVSKAATERTRAVRGNSRRIIAGNGIAAALEALALAIVLGFQVGEEPWGIGLQIVLSLISFLILTGILVRMQQMTRQSNTWLELRLAAESLRALKSFRMYTDPLVTHVQAHGRAWHRFVLSVNLNYLCKEEQLSFAEFRESYYKTRIRDQMAYFSRKAKPEGGFSCLSSTVIQVISYAALTSILLAVLDFSYHLWFGPEASSSHHLGLEPSAVPYLETLLYLLPMILPLLAGILLALRRTQDLSRREYRYHQMEEQLKRAERDFESARSPQTVQVVIARVEQILLAERIEFEAAQKISME